MAMSDTAQLRYSVVLEPFEEHGRRGYNVSVPALPGCLTSGETREEALRMAREVIALYLQSLRDDGLPIPVEGVEKATIEEIVVPVPA
jgi:antitoxin HicB